MTNVINAAHARGRQGRPDGHDDGLGLTTTRAMSALLNNSTATHEARGRRSPPRSTARNADGVNLDFEPMPNALQSAYTAVRPRRAQAALGSSAHLRWPPPAAPRPGTRATTSPASPAAGAADALMVMAYDFNWSGSARAGGVSPIDSPYALDVAHRHGELPRQGPGEQAHLGRAVLRPGVDDDAAPPSTQSDVCRRRPAAAPRRAGRSLRRRGRRRRREGPPVGRHRARCRGTRTRARPTTSRSRAYYDDAVSLDVKYELINANGLRGVGIWHLRWTARAHRAVGPAVAELRLTCRSATSTTRLPRAHHLVADAGHHHRLRQRALLPAGERHPRQMAGVPGSGPGPAGRQHRYFTDDDGTVHEPSINRLAEAGITSGCTSTGSVPTAS